MSEQAKTAADTEQAPAEPRPSATAMLIRTAARGFEVYMVQRHAGSSRWPDIYVFPGGTVDAGDAALARTALLRRDGVDEDPRRKPADASFEVAALREAFEEAGLLHAAQRDGTPLTIDHRVAEARATLLAGKRTFAQTLADLNALLDARRIVHFSHWITPRREPRRFDTHFYLAPAPAGQAGSTDQIETREGIWISPAQALSRHAAGELPLVFPTIKHLERLTHFSSIDEALAFASAKPIHAVEPVFREPSGPELPPELEGQW